MPWDAIRTKRAVRAFADRAIEPDHLDRIVAAGRRAHSSKNQQRWAFVLVQDRERLVAMSRLGPYCGHIAGAAAAIALVTPDPRRRARRTASCGTWAAAAADDGRRLGARDRQLSRDGLWAGAGPRAARPPGRPALRVRHLVRVPGGPVSADAAAPAAAAWWRTSCSTERWSRRMPRLVAPTRPVGDRRPPTSSVSSTASMPGVVRSGRTGRPRPRTTPRPRRPDVAPACSEQPLVLQDVAVRLHEVPLRTDHPVDLSERRPVDLAQPAVGGLLGGHVRCSKYSSHARYSPRSLSRMRACPSSVRSRVRRSSSFAW